MIRKQVTFFIAVSLIVLALSSTVLSSEFFYGTIKGANEVVNSLKGAKDSADPMIKMERDFVFVDEAGDYFFMPDVKRTMKTSCFKKELKVFGEKKGSRLKPNRIEIFNNGKYRMLWDREEERKKNRYNK